MGGARNINTITILSLSGSQTFPAKLNTTHMGPKVIPLTFSESFQGQSLFPSPPSKPVGNRIYPTSDLSIPGIILGEEEKNRISQVEKQAKLAII